MTETFKTNNMIFDAPTYISEVSKYCTIEPGDVMWMGTDGVPENMKPGDVCEIEIERDWRAEEFPSSRSSYGSFLTHPAIASTTAAGCSGSSAWLEFGITASVTRSGNSFFSSLRDVLRHERIDAGLQVEQRHACRHATSRTASRSRRRRAAPRSPPSTSP